MIDYQKNAEFTGMDTATPTTESAAAIMQRAIAAIHTESVSEDRVRTLVAEAMPDALTADSVRQIFAESLSKAVDAIPPREIVVDIAGTRTKMDGEYMHPMFESVLQACVAGCTPLLIGPAGSGKSTLARQIAKALDREYYTQGPASSEYKYLGFVDGHGNATRTPCWDAYENGGVFCAEELDGSTAYALVAGLNMVLANGIADFANTMVKRHDDFTPIATANTWGNGATRLYVGRNQLDAATLDRFVTFHIDYDETLERAVAQNDAWTGFVQSARKAANTLKLQVLISPRASINGAHLLRAGMDRKLVAAATVWKGADENTVKKIKAQMKKDAAEAKAEAA